MAINHLIEDTAIEDYVIYLHVATAPIVSVKCHLVLPDIR